MKRTRAATSSRAVRRRTRRRYRKTLRALESHLLLLMQLLQKNIDRLVAHKRSR